MKVTEPSQLDNKPPITVNGGDVITEYDISKPDKMICGHRFLYFLVKKPKAPVRVRLMLNGTANDFIYEAPIGHPNFDIQTISLP